MISLIRKNICLTQLFPMEYAKDVKRVVSKLRHQMNSHYHHNMFFLDGGTSYVVNSQTVMIPYRLLIDDISKDKYDDFTTLEKQICCCLFLLNHDGYVREKYLHEIMSLNLEKFMLPFLAKISTDYVARILEVFYMLFSKENQLMFSDFCSDNKVQMEKNYHIMINYWNCYYKHLTKVEVKANGRLVRKGDYRQYIGYQLFTNILGYSPKGHVK